MEMHRILSSRTFHLCVIIAGIALIMTGAFHQCLWFDESYSVAIASHTFSEIWTIGSSDVHPVLFYWILHVVWLVFGQDLTAYRILTVAGTLATALLGLTHLRRDFGWKVGLLFSLIYLFLPFTSYMAIEIRMYSWATFTVMLAWIYMMRIIRMPSVDDGTPEQPTPMSTWVIFALASLTSAYLHYFSLLTAFIINLFLFVYLIAHRKQRRRDLSLFIIQALAQVAIFVPWLFALTSQLSVVSTSYWVNFTFPDTLIELIRYPFFTRQLDYASVGRYGDAARYILLVIRYLAIALAVYLALVIARKIQLSWAHSAHSGNVRSHRDSSGDSLSRRFFRWFLTPERLPATLSLGTYIGLLGIAVIASLMLKSLMIYPRYLYVCIGPLVFFCVWLLTRIDDRVLIVSCCTLLIVLAVFSQKYMCYDDYSAKNSAPIDYLRDSYQEGDLIVSSDIGFESITTLALPDIPEYYLNWQGSTWGKAYACYEPPLIEVTSWDEALNGFSGRIWILGTSSDGSEPTDVKDLLSRGDLVETSSRTFYRPYDSTNYTITCVEKDMGQSTYQNYQTLLGVPGSS